MEIRENTDQLLAQIRVNKKLYENIMEGKEMKRRFSVKKAALPLAAAILIMNVMYVGAGYIVENTALRDLFVEREEASLVVPQAQQKQEIYENITDSNVPGLSAAASKPAENSAEKESQPVDLGIYGEKIIDNDLFSIELLEKTCTGKELSFTYILTQKTDQEIIVNTFIDTAFDACSYESGSGDGLSWDKLPADCGYQLKENQMLCTMTQLGKEKYASGMYQLYAEYFLISDEPTSGTGHNYFEAPVEIIGNDDYGLSLKGELDKTEGNVHFNAYDVYVSPLNVYLELDGTYQGEVTGDWGMKSYHTITIGFADGTETTAKVLLKGMEYGDGKINVNMNASFAKAVDPDSIVKILLDDTEILPEK